MLMARLLAWQLLGNRRASLLMVCRGDGEGDEPPPEADIEEDEEEMMQDDDYYQVTNHRCAFFTRVRS